MQATTTRGFPWRSETLKLIGGSRAQSANQAGVRSAIWLRWTVIGARNWRRRAHCADLSVS